MQLRCFGEVVRMRSGELYSEEDLHRACRRIRARYRGLLPAAGAATVVEGLNLSVLMGCGRGVPVPAGQELLACALVARYHNELQQVR